MKYRIIRDIDTNNVEYFLVQKQVKYFLFWKRWSYITYYGGTLTSKAIKEFKNIEHAKRYIDHKLDNNRKVIPYP